MPSASSAPTLPFLARLLDGEKVEWKTLGEVGTFVRGTSFQKKHFVEKGVGCIHYGEIYTRYNLFAKETISYLNEEIANKARKAGYGDLIIATTSENDDDVCKSVAWLGSENIVVSNDACYYHHTLNPKYVAYFFRTDDFQRQKRTYITGTKVKRVNANDLAKITIPVPPLRVQSRIVEILDKFTQLEAELEAELEARNKQYDFYRNRLLDFALRDDLKGQVEWKTLGEVCENLDSQRRPITSNKRIKGIYPYYGASGIVDFVESYIYDGDYLLVSEDGANLLARNTPIAFSISGKTWVNNHAHVLKFDTYEGRKFVEYYLNHIDLKPYISGAAQPKLNQNNLNSIPIPLPPLSEQRRIVDILDRFDTLTNSISEGLPREIALRRKLYEYYRDALLNFPQPTPTA